MKTKKEVFLKKIEELKYTAKEQNKKHIELNAGELHRLIGGYPSPDGNHQMPTCCDAMYASKKDEDEIIYSPPKGKGASLTIKYSL